MHQTAELRTVDEDSRPSPENLVLNPGGFIPIPESDPIGDTGDTTRKDDFSKTLLTDSLSCSENQFSNTATALGSQNNDSFANQV